MANPTGSLIALTALLVLGGGGCSLPGHRADPATSHVMHAIDSLMEPYRAPGMPGASVLVIKGDQVVVNRSWGLANVEAGVATSDSASYRLASLSKQFTAAAIILLVRDGRLAYDTRIGEVLPDLPTHARDVTVRQLLTHTSGLWAYESFVPGSQTVQVRDGDVPGLLARADSTYFRPGSGYRYSNTGYALLALIVEKLSGQRYAQFLHDRIFAPLGMNATVAHEEGISTVTNRAFGYTIRSSGVVRTDQSSTSAVLGDGGVYSSIRDLIRWHRALDAAQLLRREELDLAWTPMRLSDGTVTRYGFGWFTEREEGSLRLSHHGETSGFTNFVLKYPERGLTVVVLTNRRGGAPWDIAASIARLPELR